MVKIICHFNAVYKKLKNFNKFEQFLELLLKTNNEKNQNCVTDFQFFNHKKNNFFKLYLKMFRFLLSTA